MKRFLWVALCCTWGTAVASYTVTQNDIRKWIQQDVLPWRGNEWRRYTESAKAANNQTYTSLYINGQYMASFSDDGTCRSQIKDLIRWTNAETDRMNDNEGSRILRDLDNGWYDEAKAKNDKLIESLCECRRVQNPNYNAQAQATKNDLGGPFGPPAGADPSPSGQPPGGGLLDVAPVRKLAAATADVDAMLASMDIDKMVGADANPPKTSKTPKPDDGAVAYVGKSRTPIYSFKVNTQIDEPVKDYKWDVRLSEPPKASQIILKHMKASMTDEQYDNLRAYWWNSETGTEPNYVGTNNGTYYFEDGNTRYEVTPNKFFTPAVSIKKSSSIDRKHDLENNEDELSINWEAKWEIASMAAIMPDGKTVSLKSQAEAVAGAGVKGGNPQVSVFEKAEVEASGSRQLSYSSGVNIEVDKDGKISFYKIEANVAVKGSAGLSAGYAFTDEEHSVSVPLIFDYKDKQEGDGVRVDISAGPAVMGATNKSNEKSLGAGVGLNDLVNIYGEAGFKKTDLTDAFRNDPAAVTRYLKKEIESSKKTIGVISHDRVAAEKNGTINLAGAFLNSEEQKEKAKIETYNKLITEIAKTGSTDSVMYSK